MSCADADNPFFVWPQGVLRLAPPPLLPALCAAAGTAGRAAADLSSRGLASAAARLAQPEANGVMGSIPGGGGGGFGGEGCIEEGVGLQHGGNGGMSQPLLGHQHEMHPSSWESSNEVVAHRQEVSDGGEGGEGGGRRALENGDSATASRENVKKRGLGRNSSLRAGGVRGVLGPVLSRAAGRLERVAGAGRDGGRNGVVSGGGFRAGLMGGRRPLLTKTLEWNLRW